MSVPELQPMIKQEVDQSIPDFRIGAMKPRAQITYGKRGDGKHAHYPVVSSNLNRRGQLAAARKRRKVEGGQGWQVPPSGQVGEESAPPGGQNGAQTAPPSGQVGEESAPPGGQNGAQTAPPSGQVGEESAAPGGQNGADSAPPSGQVNMKTIEMNLQDLQPIKHESMETISDISSSTIGAMQPKERAMYSKRGRGKQAYYSMVSSRHGRRRQLAGARQELAAARQRRKVQGGQGLKRYF